ncbi:MAG: alkaline phosphatase family protein, partial [Planctomycetales bacterium]
QPSPEPIRGMIVGGLDSPSVEAALAPHPEFASRLRSAGVRYDLKTIWKRTPTSLEELSRNIEETKAVFRGRVEAAKIADEMTDWRFFMLHFQTLDSLLHRLWPFLGIDPSSRAPDAWVSKTQEAFVALDECLGELLELASRRSADAVVLSGHGFGELHAEISLPELLWRNGLVAPATIGDRLVRQGRRWVGSVRRWTARGMRSGRGAGSLTRSFQAALPVNWRRSAAVAAHGAMAALVYLNTPERFGSGPLTTSEACDQAAADVIGALRDARSPETDQPLFEDVYRVSERMDCDPLKRMLADVVGIPAAGFHVRHEFNSQGRLLTKNPGLPATHRKQGVLMIDAPGAVVGQRTAAEMRDAAPTVMRLLGLPAEPSMEGKPMTDMLGGSPVESDASVSSARVRRDATPSPHYRPVDQAEVEDRSRELGRLE